MKLRLRASVTLSLLLLAMVFVPGMSTAQAGKPAAAQLLESSGFDAMLRHDASSGTKMMAAAPELLPAELRTEMSRAIDRTTAYAAMRQSMVEVLTSRLASAELDRHSRWWASSPGKAVSLAHVAAFRDMTATNPDARSGRNPERVPNPAAQGLERESPFGALLPELASTSRSIEECLRLTLGLRRICVDAREASGGTAVGVPDILITQYSRLTNADIAAYRTYLKSPGAREAIAALGEAYLRTRIGSYSNVQKEMDAAMARFAKDEVGADKDAMLRSVIARVDREVSLDEANIMLHLLRSLTPRDPRIFVELARVAMKRGPLVGRDFPGRPPPVDPTYLADAQSWIDRAIAIEPKRADTLVLAGHLAYLKNEHAKSISLLEQARRIGTSNPWLRLNLSDALWALGQDKDNDRVLLGRAAKELKAAIEQSLPPGMGWQANYSLAHIYSDLGDIANANAQFQKLVALSQGYSQREALQAYAHFLFFSAHDLDGSLTALRRASRIDSHRDDNSFFAQVLLVKAGKLYASGQAAEAAKLVSEAKLAKPGIERNYANLARLPLMLPAVFALRRSGAIGDLSNSEGGLALLYACGHASAADVEQLIRWRANPNYLHPDEGTPLYRAISARNLAALRVLLANGADVGVRDHQGRLPLEYAELVIDTTKPKDASVLAALKAAAKGNAAAEPAGAPLKQGYVYQALKRISGDRYGYDLEVGMQVTFDGYCRYSDDSLACLSFKYPGEKLMKDVALEKVHLASWQEWFKEIGPADAPK